MAEIVAMIVVYYLGPGSYLRLTLIDAGIMTVLIFPLLYFLSFRPLLLFIDKSKHAEEILLRSLDLQERFFDSIDTLIAYMDRDFNYIRVNEAYGKADGKQPEDFIGRNHFERFPGAENQAIFQRVLETGDAYSVYEEPFESPAHPERGVTYWNWSLLPVRGKWGRVEGLVLSQVDVTERVRAEAKNRMLSRIVEQTGDTVVVTDRVGVIEYVNPTFEHLTGYSMEEALGKTPRVLKSHVHDGQFYKGMWDTILAGGIFQSEIANCKKDGELFYEVKTITPLRDERGNITHFVATGKDITAHKQAEKKLEKAYADLELRVQARTEELRIANSELGEEIAERKMVEVAIRESEEKYRNLFNNMSEGFGLHEVILDEDGKPSDYRFLEVNGAFERLTGLSREKILGRTVKEVMPDIEPYWIETYGKVTLTGEPAHFINHSAPLGKWYEIYCYSPRQGQFAVLFFDVTERMRVEEALRESEERFRAVFERAKDAIVVTDPQAGGRVLSANPAACRMFGYSWEEFLELDREAMLDTSDPNLAAMMEHRDRFGEGTAELMYKRKDGLRFPGEISSTFFQDKSGGRRAVTIIRDITERKQAEAEIQQAAVEVHAANEELRRFNTLMVGREVRMIELKKEVNELCTSTDQPPRYSLEFEKVPTSSDNGTNHGQPSLPTDE